MKKGITFKVFFSALFIKRYNKSTKAMKFLNEARVGKITIDRAIKLIKKERRMK